MFKEFPSETLYAYPLSEIRDPEPALLALKKFEPLVPDDSPTAIYIHVPFCLHLCHFCGFVKSNNLSPQIVEDYCADLEKEITLVCNFLGHRNHQINSLFFGGGTASILSLSQIEQILILLHRQFNIAMDAELTFEGECLTLRRPGYLDNLRQFGFRRISYGVQVMDMGARAILNLKPSHNALRELTEKATALFDDVAVDYIYGWPSQNLDFLVRDFETLLEVVRPLSIEIFQFEKLDASPAWLRSLYSSGALELSTKELQQLRMNLKSLLRAAGYKLESYTKFTRSQFQPPVTYSHCYYGWNNGNVLGFGRGAQSFYGGAMWGNGLDAETYNIALHESRIPVRDFAIYNTDERESVTWPRRGWISTNKLGIEFAAKVKRLVDCGYAKPEGDWIVITEAGDQWIPCILDYMMPSHQQKLARSVSKERLILRT